jgi:Ca2+-binding RTX toxin-like protein
LGRVLINPADSDLTRDDAIVALAGDDVVEGDSGTDIAALGDGNDRFIWNPGDGDDIVDGGDGTDTLEFNGSDVAELMTVTTLDDGGFRFFRDVGDITVDTTNVERIEVNALGGDDTVDGSAQTRSDAVLDIRGGAGNDSLTGGAGNDFIEGNTGDDARRSRLRLPERRGSTGFLRLISCNDSPPLAALESRDLVQMCQVFALQHVSSV